MPQNAGPCASGLHVGWMLGLQQGEKDHRCPFPIG